MPTKKELIAAVEASLAKLDTDTDINDAAQARALAAADNASQTAAAQADDTTQALADIKALTDFLSQPAAGPAPLARGTRRV